MSFYTSLTQAQKLYSMYFIAKYESSWSWDGHNYTANVNYGDPFTVGIMQWAGGAAWSLLDTLRRSGTYASYYAALPQRWKDAVVAGSTDPLWGGYSMTQDDIETWRAANANNLQQAKEFQERYWMDTTNRESLKAELDVLEGWGPLPDPPTLQQVRNVFFYLARYHNCGNNMRQVYDTYGWSGNLADIRDATLSMYQGFTNFGIYGTGWTNAINDNYDLLSAWDGVTVPDFGQVSIGYGVDNGAGNRNTSPYDTYSWDARIKEITEFGDSLVVVMGDGSKVMCHRANAGNVWLPYKRVVASGSDSPSSQSGSSSMSAVMRQVMAFYLQHANAYGYSLDPSQFDDPATYGVTNCSAWIRYVARTLAPGSEMANMSYSYTGVMAVTGQEVARGTSNTPFPYDLAQPGDVFLVNWYYHNSDYDHVELFMGTEAQGNTSGNELWGAGSAPCPHGNGNADVYRRYTYDWQLRRISWEV